MNRISIKLKKKFDTLSQTMATKAWVYGYFVSTVTMFDHIGYAVIQTEHGEFDLVYFNAIEVHENANDTDKPKEE